MAALVSITMAPARVTRQVTTDSAGYYALVIDAGSGDYLVHASAPLWNSARTRITRQASESTFVVDLKLTPKIAQVATVSVEATRLRPSRRSEESVGVGAAEQIAAGIRAGVAPDDAGDIAALAATIPGIQVVSGGVSVLGLDPSQSRVSLNGLAFNGPTIPRDARTRTRVTTSTYDVARGGFSGGEVMVELTPGGPFTSQHAHLTLDSPFLQAGDQLARRIGATYQRIAGSVGGDGELVENKWYYNVAAQGARTSADARTIFDGDSALLRISGVPTDSIRRMQSLLFSQGIPVVAGVPSTRASEEVSVAIRVDRPQNDSRTFQPLPETWGILGYAYYRRDGLVSYAPNATLAHAGDASTGIGTVQLSYSRFFGPHADWLNDTRASISSSRSTSQPYAKLPEGRVLLPSTLVDSASGVSPLLFGGGLPQSMNSTTRRFEIVNETQLYRRSSSTVHRLKFYSEADFTSYEQRSLTNGYGTFLFNSIADLAQGRPMAFSRALAAPLVAGGEWSSALALGDDWKPTPTLELLYGVRGEGNMFTVAPIDNPNISRAFGPANSYAPNTVHLSPRFGFTWAIGRHDDAADGLTVSQLGEFARPPMGMLRGGIGEFRNVLPPNLLANAIAATGLSDSPRELNCIGATAPAPDWARYAADPSAIPSTCVGQGTVLSTEAPTVQLFDRGYQPPRSWRANMAWSSALPHLDYSLEGVVSINEDQTGIRDLNFKSETQFRLTDEGGRRIYVSAASIDPMSGAVSSVESRRLATYGAVLSHVSNLSSVSRQMVLTVTPQLPLGRYALRFSYLLSSVRAKTRGFDASTFEDPGQLFTSRAPLDSRHQFQLQAGAAFPGGISVTFFGEVSSGLPFTPLVGSDINGDGLTNDRAFIFSPNPSITRDSVVRTQMAALLKTAPRRTHACLTSQLAMAAAPSSCEGSWTERLNIRIGLDPSFLQRRRLHAEINLSNPLGGLDQLLHGTDKLRGWGTAAPPDPVLLYTRGFDPQSQSFQYTVNPRFGDTRPSSIAFRSPFRASFDLTVALGPLLAEQQLDRWLRPGRAGRAGPRLTADQLQMRYASTVPNPFQLVLRESDSLFLTRSQTERLQHEAQQFAASADSIWAPLGQYLAALGDRYETSSALREVDDASTQAWDLAWRLSRTLTEILTPTQLRLMPALAIRLVGGAHPPQFRLYRQ